MFATSFWKLIWSSPEYLSSNITSDEKKHRIVWAKVSSIYDGDTFTVVYIQDGVLCKRRCRCSGYDSPEIKTKNLEEKKKACEAKEFLKTKLPKYVFKLKIYGLDKYGRFLVDIKIKKKFLKDIMIEAGHGYPYDGGTKKEFGL